jgi:hypothetical protein
VSAVAGKGAITTERRAWLRFVAGPCWLQARDSSKIATIHPYQESTSAFGFISFNNWKINCFKKLIWPAELPSRWIPRADTITLRFQPAI